MGLQVGQLVVGVAVIEEEVVGTTSRRETTLNDVIIIHDSVS